MLIIEIFLYYCIIEIVSLLKNINMKICVIIPCYKVKKYILDVIKSIDSNIEKIYVVDDCCPEKTGEYVTNNCKDKRVVIIKHLKNLGVGGATISGYKKAVADGMNIAVKMDGDGQMDASKISRLVKPIIDKQADYTKGNRFFNLDTLMVMPKNRLFGNALLSFMTKLSSGYWNIFDPTNGFTSINTKLIKLLPVDKISERYFFESDILFRLNLLKAVVRDIPINAYYGDEVSNLEIKKIIGEFLLKHVRNLFKRILYNYYLRDFSIASIELFIGVLMLGFGLLWGVSTWISFYKLGLFSPVGTVMLSTITIILGVQLLISFISYDISNVPNKSIYN